MSSIAAAPPHAWQPWPERLFGKSPISPFWVGIGISLFALTVLLVMAGLSGELRVFAESEREFLHHRDARLAVFLCALIGFLPASQQYVLRFTQTNLRDLEPLLGRGAESLELARPGFFACTLPGILLVPAVAYAIDRDFSLYLHPQYFDLTHVFQWSVGLFCTINIVSSTHLTLRCASAVAQRAEAIPPIDLLDLAPLAPFARQSLQTLLVSLLGLSIISVNAVDPGFFVPLVVFSILHFSVSGVSALRCNRTVHRRIREAKRAEMLRVNAALRGEAGALAGLTLGVAQEGTVPSPADLLAYRGFVEDRREWAFDASAWLRTLLYLAIPLGSWLGGALVERALEVSLQ